MITRLSFDHRPKELASRQSGTAEVALLWSRRSHCAAVAVQDDASGEYFELLIEPGDDPLDVFEHPYAYAARKAVSRAA